jgi:hypothetical protein
MTSDRTGGQLPVVGPQRHDVVRGCRRLGVGLGEDGGGEGELGDLMAQLADLPALRGDGLAELGNGFAGAVPPR